MHIRQQKYLQIRFVLIWNIMFMLQAAEANTEKQLPHYITAATNTYQRSGPGLLSG